MKRRKVKAKPYVRCTECGWRSRFDRLESPPVCGSCGSEALEVETDIGEWIPEDWWAADGPAPASMEKRFGFLALIAGLLSPPEVVASNDEIASGRGALSPSTPVNMVKRSLLSESEARALLSYLAGYEQTPLDLEFGNLAEKAGHLAAEKIEAWNVAPGDGLPPVPWPVKALEEDAMRLPAVLAVLDVQSRKGRGLKNELRSALRRPPRSRTTRSWRDHVGRVAAGIGRTGRAIGKRYSQLIVVAVFVGGLVAAGALAARAGQRWYRTSLSFAESSAHLLKCSKCGETVAIRGTVKAECVNCQEEELSWVRRCASCFRLQASGVHYPQPPEKSERCKSCRKSRWTTPYRFLEGGHAGPP